jgi:pyruvate/2-oxoacid:ferredoxin oxidoreductase alpha subunit/NAD-dependent dihydropyrimidine dehydrogenase PreA subunit
MSRAAERPKPFLFPQYCKGCGRCIESCPKHCITPGDSIEPSTGLTPVHLDLADCTGCGLCVSACPEPYGLGNEPQEDWHDFFAIAPDGWSGPLEPVARPVPAERIALPPMEPLVLKGAYAASMGALLAGCRHFFGYPITPSTDGAELMAKLLPKLDGVFLQAVSEVAAVNMMYGCGGAGLPAMTFTSSPGFSLMLEGISYMIGAELPGVFVDVMRGGPGLGNIAPEQSDIKLACRGLGHGNTHAIVLAPSTPQEMLDVAMDAFALSFKYRNPVVILGDGYLGQMTGKVSLPDHAVKPGLPAWAVYGDEEHRANLICSIILVEADLEEHNRKLNAKYDRMRRSEQRSERYLCDDAEVVVVACNTPARMAKGAVQSLRGRGIKAGLFRPITLWPFPIDALAEVLPGARAIVFVEASAGQLEDELRLAVSHRGLEMPPVVGRVQRYGGILPQLDEIVTAVSSLSQGVLS